MQNDTILMTNTKGFEASTDENISEIMLQDIFGFNVGVDNEIHLIGTISDLGAMKGGDHNLIFTSQVVIVSNTESFNLRRIIDISDFTAPMVLSVEETTRETNDVIFLQSYLFVFSTTLGLEIYDISNLRHPIRIGVVDMLHPVQEAYIDGTFAYGVGPFNLVVVDISDPFNPEVVAIQDLKQGNDVVVSGEYVYVADLHEGFLVFKWP